MEEEEEGLLVAVEEEVAFLEVGEEVANLLVAVEVVEEARMLVLVGLTC